MTKARLLLVVPDDCAITREARAERRSLYQSVADKIGAELLVAGDGVPQLLEVPLLTEVVPAPASLRRALCYAVPLSLLGWAAFGGLAWLGCRLLV